MVTKLPPMRREKMSKVDNPLIRKIVKKHVVMLNKLDQHLGCVVCHGPLENGKCPECQ